VLCFVLCNRSLCNRSSVAFCLLLAKGTIDADSTLSVASKSNAGGGLAFG
jgi:hypothetical protein